METSRSDPLAVAYERGLLHGWIPQHPFAPEPTWSRAERRAYAEGFDAGVDGLIDEREAA